MAKGKFKIKTHKVPDEVFVVVINPWGDGRGNLSSVPHFDNIGAWFELMLKDQLRPGDPGVLTIYYQGTHRNLIVELHSYIDVISCLGEHDYSRFVNGIQVPGKSLIYEYNYEMFGDPAEKSWKTGVPDYPQIHPKFPVKVPYPPALPAPEYPPSDVRWAKMLSPEVLERIQERLRATTSSLSAATTPATQSYTSVTLDALRDPRRRQPPDFTRTASPKPQSDTQPIPNPTLDQFTPYEPPSHHPRHTRYPNVNNYNEETSQEYNRQQSSSTEEMSPRIKPEPRDNGIRAKKLDPYEEAEVSTQVLRTEDRVKLEPGQFTSLPMVKNEDSRDERTPDLRPSMTLQTPPPSSSRDYRYSIKNESIDTNVKKERTEDDYEPSKDLIKAFASLPPDVLKISDHSSSSKENTASVKNENLYEPSNELMKAFASLPPEALHTNQDLQNGDRPKESTASVKNENAYGLSKELTRDFSSTVSVKNEEQVYEPSNELMKAFASLPPETFQDNQPTAEIRYQERSDDRVDVKSEPCLAESHLASEDPRVLLKRSGGPSQMESEAPSKKIKMEPSRY
ncbi:hypothetical protein BDQ17DRAFT_1372653 [Cyathus striatus]|nr:hypothetical protein BDQ17DRAFT_1372653 [Cyathus striatus]